MKKTRLANPHVAILIGLICFSVAPGNAQDTGTWKNNLGENPSFIQNKGQFAVRGEHFNNEEVIYAYDGAAEDFLFSPNGVILEFSSMKRAVKSDGEKAARKARKAEGFESLEDWQEFERAGTRLDITYDQVRAEWVGANPNVQIVPGRQKADYHSYSFVNETGVEVNESNIPGYATLTYKNLYPNIDVLYEFHPDGGFKYSVIVHPGGDVSKVKLRYSKMPWLLSDGTITTQTVFGDVIDHAPLTFYEGNENEVVASKYRLNSDVISFELGAYDASRTIIIDPWTQTPAFNTNWDCIWETETDAAGNVYIIGGVMPMQLIKYNAAGAIQWTYNTPYDTTAWLGVFATDDVGNSYVTNGSVAQIQMVNTAGAVVWNNPNPGGLFSSTEFWNIAFNCDQTKLVIGGTGGVLPPEPYLYDVDMATGNVLTSVKVTESTIAGIPPNTQEVRAVTATENEKYYFLTHDSIGYVDQGLTLCPGQTGPFHVENGGYDLGYKCENWRYNNTGIEAIAYYGGFIYVNRGDRLDKRDFNTANIIATAPIPGGVFTNVFLGGNQVENSGIVIDDCGNIFVGSSNGMVKYDQNLTQLATYPTAFKVYDVAIGTGGEVVAAGSTGDSNSSSRQGSVQSFAAGACVPQSTVCCNPDICDEPAMCDTDPPVTFTVFTPGGTWSPAATGFNTGTGTFDPAAAGPGTYTFYYTLACGMDSITVTVSNCSAMVLCVEANGDITVSGGTAPFTWLEPTWTQDCSGCIVGCIVPPGCATNVLTWTSFGTGTTITPPVGADSIAIQDGMGNTDYYYDITLIPPCSACDATITPAGPFCVTDAPTTLSAAQTGGTWTGTGITNGSTGDFDPGTAGAGVWNIVYTLACGDTDNINITVNATDDPSFTYSAGSFCTADPNPLPTITGLTGGSFSIDNGGTINSSTGEIDLLTSGVGSYVVTYLTNGPCPTSTTFNITITAGGNATIDPVGTFCETDASTILTAAQTGGTWTGTGIVNGTTGEFDPAVATAGNHWVYYTISGSCGDVDSVNITVNAADDPSFSYAAGSFCTVDPNPTPTITGLGGGSFNIDNGGTINLGTGEIDIALSGTGTFTVTYVTNGPCPDSTTFSVTITAGGNATIDPVGTFCETDASTILTAAQTGGTWTGTGIVNGTTGEFDPAVATAGNHWVYYTISGSCGDVDSVNITVNAADDPSFSYAAGSFCTVDPNPTPTITGLGGGSFNIDNGGTINSGTGEIDIALSGTGTFTVTYVTNGPCPDSTTFSVTITSGANATIDPVGTFCENDASSILTAADPGGNWTGTGIVNGTTGEFDPAVATAGNHWIYYTISGSCGDVDSVNVTVNAADDPSFNYTAGSYCTIDPNPTPTITGLGGGTFNIDNGGVINSGSGEIDIALSGTGTFTVTYVTNGPCPDSTTFSVTITTGANATIDPVGTFCENDPSTILTAADPGGNWTGTGIINGTTGEFDPATATAGTHWVYYTISGSCGDVDSVNITVSASDDPSFTYNPASYCTSDPNPLPSITGTPGGSFAIDNSGVINSGTGEIDIAGSGSGTFNITYTTPGVCPDSATFTVTISAGFDATITPVADVCANDPVFNFTAVDPGGNWTGTGITNGTAGTFDPATAGVGTHTITYTISGSCGDVDSTQINVLPVDDASFAYTTSVLCVADANPVPGITGAPGGTFTISGGGSINPTTGEVDLLATGAGTFTVTYTTNGVCPATSTTTITITPQLDASINPAGPFCFDDAATTLTAANAGGTWSGQGVDAVSGLFDPTSVAPGTYDIIYTIAGACGDADTIQVVVNGPPNIDAGADTTISLGSSASLLATGGTSYLWTPPGDLSCTMCPDPTASPLVTTTYYVTATDANGCVGMDSVTVNVVDDFDIFMPNIFSPDGSGYNDVLYVRGYGIRELQFMVYDRWGEKVFESNDISIGWDGTFNGKNCNNGIYVYVIYATGYLSEEPLELSGNVMLMR